jgi:hypothetical protein
MRPPRADRIPFARTDIRNGRPRDVIDRAIAAHFLAKANGEQPVDNSISSLIAVAVVMACT